jgi:hypothetical protein
MRRCRGLDSPQAVSLRRALCAASSIPRKSSNAAIPTRSTTRIVARGRTAAHPVNALTGKRAPSPSRSPSAIVGIRYSVANARETTAAHRACTAFPCRASERMAWTAPLCVPIYALPTVSRSRGARDRRWAWLSSRHVTPKPRATLRERELQRDADRPHASNGAHEAPSPRRTRCAGATLAHRRARAPRRRDAESRRTVAHPSARPNAAKNWCTRAAAGQPTNAESPNRGAWAFSLRCGSFRT